MSVQSLQDRAGMVCSVTAPFAAELCGYRPNGNPSTSDNNDSGSIEWGHALFRALGVAPGQSEIPKVGSVMEARAAEHLQSLRADLRIANSRSASEFEQYRHLNVFKTFTRNYKGPSELLSTVEFELEKALQADASGVRSRLRAAAAEAAADHELVMQLSDSMPEESMLKLDITASVPTDPARLLVGLSSKWSLRTDRAQDCVSQGAKLVSLRRGHMPHYAVLTMEPRPSMLKLIAYGSGSVDCVYHVALPELRAAAAEIAATKREGLDRWPPRLMLERMVSQGRVRSYGHLVDEILRVT